MNSVRNRILLPVYLLAAALACGRAEANYPNPLPEGDHTFTMQHAGRNRSYIVHVPPLAAAGEPLPLVLNFHGAGRPAW